MTDVFRKTIEQMRRENNATRSAPGRRPHDPDAIEVLEEALSEIERLTNRVDELEEALIRCYELRANGDQVREAIGETLDPPPPENLDQVGQLIAEDARLYSDPEGQQWP